MSNARKKRTADKKKHGCLSCCFISFALMLTIVSVCRAIFKEALGGDKHA